MAVQGVKPCPYCSELMVRASAYDPDGTIAMHGGEKVFDKKGVLVDYWVCINKECIIGRYNA